MEQFVAVSEKCVCCVGCSVYRMPMSVWRLFMISCVRWWNRWHLRIFCNGTFMPCCYTIGLTSTTDHIVD